MITITDTKLIIEINAPDPRQELFFIQNSLLDLLKDYFAENEMQDEQGNKKDFYPILNLLTQLQKESS